MMSSTSVMVPFPRAPQSRTYMSQRTRLHYLDWGNDGAPPLILQHGGRDHAHSWDYIAAALCDRWHVIAPDLRGHGDSGWSAEGSYSIAALLFDLVELVRQRDFSTVSIVGHSLAGKTALRYAGLYPDKVARIVAIEGTGLPFGRNKPLAERWRNWIHAKQTGAGFQPICYASFDDVLGRMRAAYPSLGEECARHLTRHGTVRNGDGSYSWKYDPAVRMFLPADVTPEEERNLWRSIRCPAMLVWGTASWARDPLVDGSAAEFADCQVLHVPGAGHWPQHDSAELVASEIGRFLEGEGAARP